MPPLVRRLTSILVVPVVKMCVFRIVRIVAMLVFMLRAVVVPVGMRVRLIVPLNCVRMGVNRSVRMPVLRRLRFVFHRALPFLRLKTVLLHFWRFD